MRDRRCFLSEMAAFGLGLSPAVLAPVGRPPRRRPASPAYPGQEATKGRRTSGHHIDIRDYGAVGDGEADDTGAVERAAEAAATQDKALTAPAGTYLLSRSVNLDDTYLWGDGFGLTVFETVGSDHAAFVLTRDAAPGSGLSNLTVREGGAGNSGIAMRTVRHARIAHVQAEDFVGERSAGFLFENWDGSWTESNLVFGCRAAGCTHGFHFTQHPERPGTESFGYNKLIGFTVSRMPDRSAGISVTQGAPPPTLYGARLSGNVYLADSEDCCGISIDGLFNENYLSCSGERIGSDAPAYGLAIGPEASFRRNAGRVLFQRGVRYRLSPGAGIADNHLATYDGRRYLVSRPYTGFRAHLESKLELPTGSDRRIPFREVTRDTMGWASDDGGSPSGLTGGSYLVSLRVTVRTSARRTRVQLKLQRDKRKTEVFSDRSVDTSTARTIHATSVVQLGRDQASAPSFTIRTDAPGALLAGEENTTVELVYLSA